ncbi:putative vegetative incompatibility protein HET-E-1 [Rhizoctonia solani 123E]|uniref:Putative vegetative incompatibility protein HET-E-1 n=1 Tax=Rhizoctonia solani 123E TaxID=1423351 RepID=A0A074RM34_9AGAM|nr:putative vegetative incompatibility protein HET-E-1 [Rhizoctonia solani 123E]
MSSQFPPSDQEKHGIRKSIRKGAKWFKDAVRPSSAPPSSGNPESLAAPNIGSENLSLSRPTTPLLAPAPPPADLELDRGGVTPSPGPATQTFVPDTKVETPMEHNKSDNAGLSRLIGALRTIESTVELFPPLKSAVGALIGSLDIVQSEQKAVTNRADYEDLADEFELLAKMVRQYAGELESEPSNGSIANIAQCIREQVTDIGRKEASGTVGRLWDATENQEDVIRRYRQVERLFRQIQVRAQCSCACGFSLTVAKARSVYANKERG